MILGSLLGAILYTKRKYGENWKSQVVWTAFWDWVIVALLGEAVSRFVLGHSELYPVLMMKVKSFGIKYYCLLFIMALFLPFVFSIILRICRKGILKLESATRKLSMDKKFFSGYKQEILFVSIFATVIFCGIMMGTRVIWSGYHFMDDHHIITTMIRKEKMGYFEIIKRNIEGDMETRFRPFYWVLFITKLYLFEMNIAGIMILTMVEGVSTFVILYLFACKMKTSQIEAFLFSMLMILGEQFAPWFRFPNTENDGFLMVALIMYLISDVYGQVEKKQYQKKCLICFFITLCSLQKESFVLMLPSYLMLAMAVLRSNGNREEFLKLIKREAFTISYVCLLGIFELYIIVFKIGTNKTGYAGFNAETPISKYINGIYVSLFGDLRYHTLFLCFCIVLCIGIVLYDRCKIEKRKESQRWLLLTAWYIIISQLALYAKSTMFDRYIIPYIAGWGVLCLIFMWRWLRKYSLLYWIHILLCIALSVFCLSDSAISSREWAKRGENIGRLLYVLKDELAVFPNANILVNIRATEEEGSLVEWENYYGNGEWNWVELKSLKEEGKLDELMPRDYDFIVSHYMEYYHTEEVSENAHIKKEDYEEIHNIDYEYVILRYKERE